MDFVFSICGYETSRDYEQLADLMQRQSVICIVDYLNTRDVAHTLYSQTRDGSFWQVSARGISYVSAFSRQRFVEQCASANVEWLEPTQAEK